MTPIEKLINAAKRVVLAKKTGCNVIWSIESLRSALEEYDSAPKPWSPPWPLKIPDWPNVWVFIDPSGDGWFIDKEPIESLSCFSTFGSNDLEPIGRFEIPPGVDWRTMKVQVKKDGVLIGG